MEFIGEHLLPGKIGHFCSVLSFTAAILSFIGYFISTRQRHQPDDAHSWTKLGRLGFGLHGLSVFAVIGTLFYILTNKYYEYQYAFSNVSDDLPFRYTFSAFWKEQQGSFLLWSFWHIVLGGLLIFKAKRWEAPVMAVIAFAQIIIGSMILGLYFGEFRLGVSAFDLLRNTMDAPIFSQADYLSKIQGQGLNPLLQNYWMTIHPPTLFLGFASTIVPFAYAVGGLWTKDHDSWLQPVLPWALFSGAILGLGILMGGIWAYEALSFGGYWAWDPVENSSLVPWILLIAGIHTNLIARATGRSIRTTYQLYLASFVFIIYSTYLTRSGILGETSVHAFTEMGLGVQLLLFILVFLFGAIGLYLYRRSGVPTHTDEEATTSREFWMFIGALVLVFSAILITGATSLPVYNKIVQLFKPEYIGTALKDPVEHHNRYQLWIAVFIGLLTGAAQFLRYKETNWEAHKAAVNKHIGIALIGAAILTAINVQWLNITAWQYYTMLFAGMFTLVANLDYLVRVARGNTKMAASALSHIGFGALVLGILYTGLNKEWVSSNKFAMEGLIEGLAPEGVQKNVLLLKEAAMPIKGGLEATYLRDTVERQTRTFTVQMRRLDEKGNPTGEEFVVQPNVMYDRAFTKVVAANPSTKHYWNKDIFTLVSSLPKAELDADFAKAQEDSLKYTTYMLAPGDTIITEDNRIILDEITRTPTHPEYKAEAGDLAFGLNLRATSLSNPNITDKTATPMMYLRPGKGGFSLGAAVPTAQLRFRLREVAMESLMKIEEGLQYTDFDLAEGGTYTYQGYTVQLSGLNKSPKSQGYQPQEGDIALSAMLKVTSPSGATYTAEPLFLLRGKQTFQIKDQVSKENLHFRFLSVNPQNANFTLSVAKTPAALAKIPVEISEDAPRSDYIVMEAILFPGINLVWIGSFLMLIGLGLGMWNRRKT